MDQIKPRLDEIYAALETPSDRFRQDLLDRRGWAGGIAGDAQQGEAGLVARGAVALLLQAQLEVAVRQDASRRRRPAALHHEDHAAEVEDVAGRHLGQHREIADPLHVPGHPLHCLGPPAPELIGAHVPAARDRAKDLGIINIAIVCPGAIGAVIAAPLVSLAGYPALFGATAVVAVAAAIGVWKIKSVS